MSSTVQNLSVPRTEIERRLIERKEFQNNIYLLALAVFMIFWMIPVIWTVVTSFREEAAIQRHLASFIPTPFTLENWEFLLGSSMLPRWFFNSVFVSGIHTILVLLLGTLAAFSFARLNFYGRRILYPLVLAGLMIPTQITFIPIYLLFSDLHLLNTYYALIIPGIASSFAVFLLTQFFQGIPIELEEAAYLDGASRFGVYWRIILPLSIPVLVTLAIFTFLNHWNQYLWPLVAATKREVYTLPIGLRKITQAWGFIEFYGRNMAAAALSALPIVIFVFVFQRRIISGISINSGIK